MLFTPDEDYSNRIIQIGQQYDDDPKLRFELLKYVYGGPIRPDIYAARERINWRLNQFVTAVWIREKIVGYLELVQLWRDHVRGKAKPENPIGDAFKIEMLRSLWLEDSNFRDLVDKLLSKLEEGARLCNLQMINGWVYRVVEFVEYGCSLEHELLRDLTEETVRRNHDAADRHFYGRANGYAKSQLGPMWERLAATAPDWANAIVLTERQLTLLAAGRRGIRVDIEEFAVPQAEAAANAEPIEDEATLEDILDAIDPYQRTVGGLFIPKGPGTIGAV